MSQVQAVSDEDFKQEVLDSALPVVIDFWAPWCKPCVSMAPVLSDLSDKLGKVARVVSVDIDENPSIGASYRIRSVPSFVVVNKGEHIGTIVGAKSLQQLYKEVLDIIAVPPQA